MRADLNITKVIKDWEFNGERQWLIEANGKIATFISPYKPAIGSSIPCTMESRPGTDKKTGKAVTYWDARPILDGKLVDPGDDVPNFPTPAQQASKQAENKPEQPQDALYRRISHKSEPGVYMYEPVDPRTLPAQDTPEWAKPGPKPTLTGDLYLMGRYLDVLLNHPKINLTNEVNWLGGFASVIATGLRDYHDGKLEVNVDLIPDDVRAAYLAAASGEWPKQ